MTDFSRPGGEQEPARSSAWGAWSVAGAVLALGSLGWGTVSFVGLVSHGEYDTEQTFAVAEVSEIEVRTEGGRIDLMAIDGDTISVVAHVSDGLVSTDVDIEVVDGSLQLRSACPKFAGVWCQTDFTVLAPADLPLTIQSDNGRIVVTDMHGDMRIDSDNGRVDVVGAAGDLTVRNDNGQIVATDLAADVVDVRTSNGGIQLEFSNAPDLVDVRSDNGSITIDVPDDGEAYRVATETSNGSIDNSIRTDPAGERVIDATTDNGSISIRYSR